MSLWRGPKLKRARIDREAISDIRNLSQAAVQAASGKRSRSDVARFFSSFDSNIQKLRNDFLAGKVPYNRFRSFTILDPKKRLITAVSFEDRIVHHALMHFVSPVLEKAMISDSYACRLGKGPLAAIKRAQQNIRKYQWYAKIDVEKYFETIDHEKLLLILAGKFQGEFFNNLICRIVKGYETKPGKGLPIGALTSQYFANFYLDRLDRMILEQKATRAYVRYMDDMVWWGDDKQTMKDIVSQVDAYAREKLLLKVKDNIQVQKSRMGLTFCGFRIFPGSLRLTIRKKQRYAMRRKHWETLFAKGIIEADRLQKAYDSVKGVLIHASARGWMQKQAALHPSPDA
jgi:RNA-directed DNA polymerase